MILKTLLITPLLILTLYFPIVVWDTAHERAVHRDIMLYAGTDQDARTLGEKRLEGRGQAAIPVLIRFFGQYPSNPKPKVENRRLNRVMVFLVRRPAEMVVPRLMEALDDPCSDIRHYAGLTLAFFGTEAVPSLVELLEESPEHEMRTTAAWLLALMGSDAAAAVPALEAALEDQHRHVRYTARYALGQLSPENAAFWNEMREIINRFK